MGMCMAYAPVSGAFLSTGRAMLSRISLTSEILDNLAFVNGRFLKFSMVGPIRRLKSDNLTTGFIKIIRYIQVQENNLHLGLNFLFFPKKKSLVRVMFVLL